MDPELGHGAAAGSGDGAAMPGAAAAPPLPPGWTRAWDPNHNAEYFYNADLGVTQWLPPDPDPAASHDLTAAANDSAGAEGAAAAADERCYCYLDPFDGRTLGPFTLAELAGWRAHLPMDLRLFPAGSGGGRPGGGEGDQGDPPDAFGPALPTQWQGGDSPESQEQQQQQQQQQQQEEEEEEEVQMDSGEGQQHGPGSRHTDGPQAGDGDTPHDGGTVGALLLADLLGDTHLLEAWRAAAAHWCWTAPGPREMVGAGEDGPDAARAPPAPAWEAWQQQQQQQQQQPCSHPNPMEGQEQQQYGPQQLQQQHIGSDPQAYPDVDFPSAADDAKATAAALGADRSSSRFAEYAEAVLAGLPPTDDAVVLAKTAAYYGRPLHEVMAAAASAGAPSAVAAGGYAGAAEAGGSGGAAHGEVRFARDRGGRLTAVYPTGAAGQPAAARLYGDLERWVDPAQLEASLAARGTKRGAPPAPPGGWAKYNAARDAARKRAKWADV